MGHGIGSTVHLTHSSGGLEFQVLGGLEFQVLGGLSLPPEPLRLNLPKQLRLLLVLHSAKNSFLTPEYLKVLPSSVHLISALAGGFMVSVPSQVSSAFPHSRVSGLF